MRAAPVARAFPGRVGPRLGEHLGGVRGVRASATTGRQVALDLDQNLPRADIALSYVYWMPQSLFMAMPAAVLYMKRDFVDKNPNTVQALTNAIVRADKWIQQAGPSDVVKTVPESFLLGDRAVYIDAFLKAQKALSPDGMIPDQGPATALRALQSIDDSLKNAKIDLKAVYTNDFVRKANAKYPKG